MSAAKSIADFVASSWLPPTSNPAELGRHNAIDASTSNDGSPTRRSYFRERERLSRKYMLLQSIVAVSAAVLFSQLSSVISGYWTGLGVLCVLLAIPSLNHRLDLTLSHFSISGWAEKCPQYDFRGDWDYRAVVSWKSAGPLGEREGEAVAEVGSIVISQDAFRMFVAHGWGTIATNDSPDFVFWRSTDVRFTETGQLESGFSGVWGGYTNAQAQATVTAGYEQLVVMKRDEIGRPLVLRGVYKMVVGDCSSMAIGQICYCRKMPNEAAQAAAELFAWSLLPLAGKASSK